MSQRGRVWLAIVVVAAVVRLATLSAYPLHDTTEARYSEIARLMVHSGDWITPQISGGVPFWGKPPLSFWLTSASFELFGLHEVSARLPSFLLALATLFLIFKFGRRFIAADAGIGAAAIMLTCAMGFISAGAVMTDAALAFSTTLSMVAFWFAVQSQKRIWYYLFFIGLGLGLLAKGPIAVVLVGFPVGTWLLCQRPLLPALRSIPWWSGSLTTVAVAAPWYVLAELKTPGFLEYFLLGEHWLRFVESGWSGDLYGSAHAYPRGSIWIFWLAAALPWSPIAVVAAVSAWRGRVNNAPITSLQFYLVLWMVAPLVFFTFAGNILPAYVLPGIPAFSLLLASWLNNRRSSALHCGWMISVLMVAAGLTSIFDLVSNNSEKNLVGYYQSLNSEDPLFYFPRRPYSADFYSRGTVRLVANERQLLAFLETPGTEYVAIRRKRLDSLPPGVGACLRVEASFPSHILFGKLGPGCRATINFAGD